MRANGSIACVVPLLMMGSSFVRTSNVAAGGSPAGSLITPYAGKRAVGGG